MSNRYFKGEKVLLYTKFYDENGNIPDNIDNARVRILHENNGKIYQDMNWTELKNIGGNEFFSKYNIPFNSDNGIYHVVLKGEKIKKKIKFVTSEDLITNHEAHVRGRSELTINAGFFDPKNGKTISYVVTDRMISADPMFNSSLLSNPFPFDVVSISSVCKMDFPLSVIAYHNVRSYLTAL